MTSADRNRNAEREHLVVALPHAATVKKKLKDFGIGWDRKQEDSDSRLGLALIPLEHLDRWQRGLPDRAELAGYVMAARQAAGVTHADVSALDLLLVKLRRSSAAEHAGWIPVLGKNRDVHSVTSYPEISGGRPKPSDATPPRKAPPFPLPRPYPKGRRVRVGVLDTPLYAHPDLAGRYLAAGAVFADSPEARPAWLGHSTFIASVIMRHAPEAELDVRSVFGDTDATTTTWHLAKRMVEFAGSGIDVLNLSLGCLARDRQAPMVLARAVQLLSPDIVIVAAAGNHGGGRDPSPIEEPAFPAACDGVIAVGASGGNGKPARFSRRGPWVDLFAPGVGVRGAYLWGEVKGSTGPFQGYATWSGTSMATANVTGEIAARMLRDGRDAHEIVEELLNRT